VFDCQHLMHIQLYYYSYTFIFQLQKQVILTSSSISWNRKYYWSLSNNIFSMITPEEIFSWLLNNVSTVSDKNLEWTHQADSWSFITDLLLYAEIYKSFHLFVLHCLMELSRIRCISTTCVAVNSIWKF
jgi:hypothetical protein